MFSQRNNPYCDLLQFRYYKYSRYNSYQEDFYIFFRKPPIKYVLQNRKN